MAYYPDEYLDMDDPTASSKLDTPSHSQYHINLNAETLAIETELGLTPSVAYDTVVLRLDADDVSRCIDDITTRVHDEAAKDLDSFLFDETFGL